MARDLAGLKREILAEMRAAMEDAKEEMFNAVQYEVAGYYIGTPKYYKRTYQLLTTPRADPVTSGGDTVNTRIYLFQGGGYTTGSYPSMKTVLNWTENGQARTIGRSSYWARSQKTMGAEFYKAFNYHFS